MASTSKNNTSVRFDGPQDWTNWDHAAQGEAQGLNLWKFMEPGKKIPWLVEPTRPAISDYPKKLVRVETRAASSMTATPVPEEIDLHHAPRTVGELTAEGRINLNFDMQIYLEMQKAYDKHRTNVNTLRKWFLETTASRYHATCCNNNKDLDAWYIAFKEIGAPYEKLQSLKIATRYYTAIKPLPKMTRNFNDWLIEWETMMGEAKRLELAEAMSARRWVLDIVRALQAAIPTFSNTFYSTHRTNIDDNTITVQEVINQIHEDLVIHHQYQPTASKITKGSFLSYNDEEEETQISYDEVSDAESRTGDRGKKKRPVRAQKKDQQKRKRAETFETVSRTVCKGCEMPGHSLPECFYIFENKAPEGWKPRQSIVRIIEGKIKQDSALAGEITRFKKGKVRFTDRPTDS